MASIVLTSQHIDLENADSFLVQQLSAGVPGSLEQFIALHQRRVARLARRLLGSDADVDDVSQDVFVAVLVHARSFRAKASVTTWLNTITVNQCRSRLRRQSIWKRILPWQSERSVSPPTADHASSASERESIVRSAIEKLSIRDREVVVLHYLEELGVPEIAEIVGTNANTVSVRLHRARVKLKTLLADLKPE